MRVLIACEESQTECMAFRALDGIEIREKAAAAKAAAAGTGQASA